ncbi:MAG: redoxin domain-containing protein, partial [Planctomycetes bacterium]|nr:redoxin domain-containing protein [Planctomycetota bacterium]
EKNLVVVITRGNTGEICVYCSTQVSRLIANYKKVKEQNGQVVVIYPVAGQSDSASLTEFLQSAKEKLEDPSTKLPFPALLDVNLNVVKQLDIERDLSAPATYIVDTSGNVKFAYVGETAADRPSVNEIIRQLKEINKTGATN